MLFTCTLVLSHPVSKEEVEWEHEPLEQTARYWVGQSKQEIYLGKGTSKKLSLILDRGHEGRIREVLQEDGRSSMYKVMIA
jgi:hypothetical protein